MGAAQIQGTCTDLPLQHPYLRNCRALTKNKITFLLASALTQKPQYQKWKEQVFQFQRASQSSQAAQNEYLMVPLMHKFQEGGVCSTAGQLKLQYEYYPKLLSAQISERILQSRKFNQPQLWYLLYVLVAARQTLALQNYEFGDLQPRNVFLNSNQQVKVGCMLSWPGQVSAYRKVVLQQDFGYLAPEDIQRLKLGAMDNKNNTESQIFAIGLTMLSASALQPMNDLYRIQQKQIDLQLFCARVSVFQQDRTYSDIYRAVISNLLQIQPSKRMNQQELYQFLNKHRQNLTNKKPLMFDNVNKKLQESINQLLRLVHQIPRMLPQQLNQEILLQQSPIPHRDFLVLEQRGNLQQSTGSPLQKRNNSANKDINVVTNNAGNAEAVVPARNLSNLGRLIVHNIALKQSIPTQQYQQYPIPLPHSPKSLYPLPQHKIVNLQFEYHPNQEQSTPLQKYKPFETISKNQPTKQTSVGIQKQGMVNKIEHNDHAASSKTSRVNQLRSDCEEKSLVRQLNLLMQTRRGFNVVEVVQVKRKDKAGDSRVSETPKLAQHSILKDCKESQLIIQKKQSDKIGASNSLNNTIEANKAVLPILQASKQGQTPSFKQPSVIVQKQQLPPLVQNEIKQQNEPKESVGSIPLQSVQKIAPTNTPSQQTKQEIEQQSNKQDIQKDNRFSPSIKVWGMQKGQLTVQEVTKSPLVASQTEKKEEHNHKITLLQHKTERAYSQKSGNNNVNIQTVQSDKDSKSQQSDGSAAQQKKQHNYILIEQASQSTDKSDKQLMQRQGMAHNNTINQQVTASHKTAQKVSSASQAQSTKSISAAQARSRFMYIQIATDSSFEQCWQQLQKMIHSPTLYCSQLNPDKVIPRITQYGHFLKVGPARVKVDLNKQNGKVWLQNIYGSKCEGQMLCGVLKGNDLKYYIWFNSSYAYKGRHFPSRSILQQALVIAKHHLANR